MRILSLIPSGTEIVSSIGLKDKLIGLSHECDNPRDILHLPRLTSSKISNKINSKEIHDNVGKLLKNSLTIYDVNVEMLKELAPDYIITQSQCNVCAISIEYVKSCLEKILLKKTNIIDLQAKNLKGILDDIYNCGKILKKVNEAGKIISNFNAKIKDIKKKLSKKKKKVKVLCVEWIEPLMLAGNWMPDLIRHVNGTNIVTTNEKYSPGISIEILNNLEFDVVIFLPCGFNISETLSELNYFPKLNKLLQDKKKYIVDGNKFFNRPSTCIFESIDILCEILHPEVFGSYPSYERWIEFK
tara:strand:+ start:1074 stop:1973 length:900 start_codon:yes stop_codon:yes gene_type:complete